MKAVIATLAMIAATPVQADEFEDFLWRKQAELHSRCTSKVDKESVTASMMRDLACGGHTAISQVINEYRDFTAGVGLARRCWEAEKDLESIQTDDAKLKWELFLEKVEKCKKYREQRDDDIEGEEPDNLHRN